MHLSAEIRNVLNTNCVFQNYVNTRSILWTLQFTTISLPVSRASGPVEVAATRLTWRCSARQTNPVWMGQEAHVRHYSNRLKRLQYVIFSSAR